MRANISFLKNWTSKNNLMSFPRRFHFEKKKIDLMIQVQAFPAFQENLVMGKQVKLSTLINLIMIT